MFADIDTWMQKMQDSGYRLTGSRKAVVELMASSECVLSPLEIYDLVRAGQAGIGLVTVYRTLEKLEELGLIQRVHRPQGCQAFIAAFHGHQHLILCSHCGRVQFFDGDNLEALIQAIGRETGYSISDHWLQLFGLCARCQAQAGAASTEAEASAPSSPLNPAGAASAEAGASGPSAPLDAGGAASSPSTPLNAAGAAPMDEAEG